MEAYLGILRYILPVMAMLIVGRCTLSLLKNRPRAHKMASLVMKESGEVMEINHWETSVGRSKTCDICLELPTVSRFHGVISKRSKSWVVTDTLSRAGIAVNGERVKRTSPIYHGDILTIGGVSMLFQCADALNEESKSQLRRAPRTADKAVFIDVVSQSPYYLKKKGCMIGRDPDCGIHLADRSVSKEHARVYMTPKGWVVEDLGSANGTRLNGRIIHQPQLIFDEDRVTFGAVTVIFYEK